MTTGESGLQVIRTIVWALIVAALAVFAYANWFRIDVTIWSSVVLNTPLPMIILTSFLAGFLPMWLFHRAGCWRLKRRIAALEAAQRSLIATQQEREEATIVIPESEKPTLP
ncbi:LapA family protein [Croceicoccus ponticola]|uniref:LapA family protein n=1 Tax=Croceicoccus ponticola TaxID=2217664 RepID=A0A437H026_9SPHN|nr:LapA family protein [Croceicoccus ponticola]RVQ68934.1 LapA family protein [Croceicoccus ponticola]